MSPAYESADLILKLYDLRREEVMRKAREWYRKEFHPQSAEDVVKVLSGEHSAYFRMVTSYWEMAASFVTSGVIDWKMFMEANPGEPVNVFAKLHPYLEKLRSMFASKYDDGEAFQHLEQVVMQLPHAKEQIAERIEQFKKLRGSLESTKQNITGVIHSIALPNKALARGGAIACTRVILFLQAGTCWPSSRCGTFGSAWAQSHLA